ncbi:DUF4283 domain protein [Trifolium medium]|uniref:DUF4283 domain protein n=1 Tax=Trifolium medium TaxID=97028 RepID=A0A392MC67_9FABA|nr:DUF4283 domain protein [Trifolium medium]
MQEAHQQHYQHTPHPNDIPESSTARTQTPPQQNIPRSFLYSESIIHEGVTSCKRSIIGKIITDKPIHISSIQNGLENIWGAPPGLKIQELEGKIIQFYMNNEADQDRILLGNPWIFRNSWLVVKPWDREVDYHTIDFDHVPVWVQLWGLPPHCKTKKMGESIVIIKIRVAINIHNPILSGIHIGNPTDGTCWIDYRYEKLPQDFGHYNPPIPADLLEKLAAMMVQREPAANPTKNQQYQPANHPTNSGHSPMENMQLTHKDRTKKTHRISNNLEPVLQEKSLEIGMVDHANQVKRQKMENSSRVGLAKQASPQP